MVISPQGARPPASYESFVKTNAVSVTSRFDAIKKFLFQEMTRKKFVEYWVTSRDHDGPLAATYLRKGVEVDKFVEAVSEMISPSSSEGDDSVKTESDTKVSGALNEILTDSGKRTIFLALMTDVERTAGTDALSKLVTETRRSCYGRGMADLSPLEVLILRDQSGGGQELKTFALNLVKEMSQSNKTKDAIVDLRERLRNYSGNNGTGQTGGMLSAEQKSGRATISVMELSLGESGDIFDEKHHVKQDELDNFFGTIVMMEDIEQGKAYVQLESILGQAAFGELILKSYVQRSNMDENDKINLLSYAVRQYGPKDKRVEILCEMLRKAKVDGIASNASNSVIIEKHSKYQRREGSLLFTDSLLDIRTNFARIGEINHVKYGSNGAITFKGSNFTIDHTKARCATLCQLNQLPNLEILDVATEVNYGELCDFLENRPDPNKQLTIAIGLIHKGCEKSSLSAEQVRSLMEKYKNITFLMRTPESGVAGKYPVNWDGKDYKTSSFKSFGAWAISESSLAELRKKKNSAAKWEEATFREKAIALKESNDAYVYEARCREIGLALDSLARGDFAVLAINHGSELALLLTLLPEGAVTFNDDSGKFRISIEGKVYESEKISYDSGAFQITAQTSVKVGKYEMDLFQVNHMVIECRKTYGKFESNEEKVERFNKAFSLNVEERIIKLYAEYLESHRDLGFEFSPSAENFGNELMLLLSLVSVRYSGIITLSPAKDGMFSIQCSQSINSINPNAAYFATKDYSIPANTPPGVKIHRLGLPMMAL
jgi:hypothetical protein